MIMKKNLFVVAMMVAMTGCVQEANVETPQEREKVVVEFTAGVQTKAVLDGTSVTWEEADVININGVEFTIPVVEEKAAISEDGKTAKFSAVVEPEFLQKEEFNAVYPASAYQDGNIVVPAAQNGTAKVVALATVNSIEEDLNFMHVASFFKFQVPAEVTTITLTATEALAGTIKNVAFATENDVTTVSYGVVGDGEKTITLSLAAGAKFQPKTYYYAAVLPGEKTNLALSFDGKVYKTWASVNIKQSMIANVKPKADRELKFAAAEASATMGDNSFTGLVLSGEKTGVAYTSSKTSVATVDAEGKVTLVSPGTTVITASADENNTHLAGTASYTLTVAPAPKVDRNLAFSAATATATYGQSFSAPTLSGVTDGVTYTSSDTSVATVDASTGKVTLVAGGTTTITASAHENNTHLAGTASYELKVNKAERTVSFSSTTATVTLGDDANFIEPTLNGVTNTDVISYESSDQTVATVDGNGNVTTLKDGTVKITAKIAATATHNECSAQYSLNVSLLKLYLKPNALWKSSGARFAARVWYDDNSDYWADMSDTDNDGIYEAGISAKYTKVIFCRMNPSATDNNWDNKWNQTADLEVTKEKVYTMNKDDWGNGTWKSQSEAKKYKESSDLYLVPSSEWKSAGAWFAIYCWNTTGGNAWAKMNKIDDNLYGVDLPNGYSKGCSMKFVRMNPGSSNLNWDNKWTEGPNTTSPTNNSNKIKYTLSGWDNGSWGTL